MYSYRLFTILGLCLVSHTITALELTSDNQRYSYTMGVQVGRMLQSKDVGEVDVDTLAAGIADQLSNKPTQMTQEEMRATMKAHYEKAQAERAQLTVDNKAKGKAFRDENAKRDGVTTLESGLQYEVLAAGEGAPPKAEEKVEVHYQGQLIDGSIFDSSYENKEPAQFKLNQVIPGFKEAIVLMKPGAKWRVTVPPEMAYGERGAGKKIGPNETLIFDIHYIGLAPEEKAKTETKKD